MKKAQREAYRLLTSDLDTSLCTFCKYMDYYTSSLCDEGVGDGCIHPLEIIGENSLESSFPGADCWGFAPMLKREYILDIIGIIMGKGWKHWVYNIDTLVVTGTKEAIV